MGDVIVHVFGRTDVGRTREHNEDAFVVADLTTGNATLQPEVRSHSVGPRGSLFMVADGMGGAAAGEIASAMAVDVILHELKERWIASPAKDPETFAAALRAATAVANSKIFEFASSHPEYRGMGTTATIAGLLGDTLYLAQVGDSRAYLVREGQARQITKDQSLMQKLIEAGEITEEEAEQSERRNIILQALGPEAVIKVDLTHQRVRRGDTLVLCSDGLSGQVRKDEIARIVSEEPELVTVCKRLIDLANEAGGPDNITVIAARFDGDGLGSPGMEDAVGYSVFPVGEESGTPTVPTERFVPRDPPPATATAALRPTPATAAPVSRPEPRGRGRGATLVVAVVLALGAAAAIFALRGFRAPAAPAPAPVPGAPDSVSTPAVMPPADSGATTAPTDSAVTGSADSTLPSSRGGTTPPARTR
jgi:PPM family protein phosphatase